VLNDKYKQNEVNLLPGKKTGHFKT